MEMSGRFYCSLPWIILLWFMHFLFLLFYFFFIYTKALSFLGLSALAWAVSAAEGTVQRSFSDLLSWVQLMWGCLQRYAKAANIRTSKNISFLCLVRAFPSWQSLHLLDVLKELEICLEPKHIWLIPEKFRFCSSSAARFSLTRINTWISGGLFQS